jgi:hypothetical protein
MKGRSRGDNIDSIVDFERSLDLEQSILCSFF